jgi:hypothetical protein
MGRNGPAGVSAQIFNTIFFIFLSDMVEEKYLTPFSIALLSIILFSDHPSEKRRITIFPGDSVPAIALHDCSIAIASM